jgi:fatty-acyl-CoA synthase
VMGTKAAQGLDFNGWRVIIGGAALTRSLYLRAKECGIQLTAAYGMSETCPIISCAYVNEELLAASEDQQINFRIKAGVPVALVEVAIMDEAGNRLPADGETQGELVLRAPWLTQGYFREPEKSTELWQHGWMHTGDVATLDAMGYIDIRDRIKDVIKTGGEWISSLELEDLISRYAAVREVAVIGVPDPRWSETPFALVVLHEGQTLDAKGLQEHLLPYVEEGRINKWGIPRQIAVVSEIPKTSVGKLDKKLIRVEVAKWQASNSECLSSL